MYQFLYYKYLGINISNSKVNVIRNLKYQKK